MELIWIKGKNPTTKAKREKTRMAIQLKYHQGYQTVRTHARTHGTKVSNDSRFGLPPQPPIYIYIYDPVPSPEGPPCLDPIPHPHIISYDLWWFPIFWWHTGRRYLLTPVPEQQASTTIHREGWPTHMEIERLEEKERDRVRERKRERGE